MEHHPTKLDDLLREDDELTPVTPEMVHSAEEALGYRLPATYIKLLQIQNGGYLARNWFPTTKCPRWAKDHVQFRKLMGLGEGGIDDDTGSQYLIEEWEYPDVGVVISSTGHTAFMLDYSDCGEEGEPSVIWIDVESGKDDEPYVAELAPDFATFLEQLKVPPKK